MMYGGKNMKRKTKRWICSFLTVGLVLTGMVPAQAYTKPQEAEEILQGGYAKDEQAYQIYPIPQSVDYEPGEFQITQEVNIVCEDGIDTYTKAFLEEILEKYGRTVTESSSAVSGKSNKEKNRAACCRQVDGDGCQNLICLQIQNEECEKQPDKSSYCNCDQKSPESTMGHG